MKFGKVLRALCLLMVCSLLLTSCTLFRRKKTADLTKEDDPAEDKTEDTEKDEGSVLPETPEKAPDPTPEELIAGMMDYDFGGTTLTVSVVENCSLFNEGTDSNAVLATVLEAIEKKYNTEIAFAQYSKQQLFLGTEEMVTEGSSTAYFTDMLILPATEYARYRNAGLLERLEMIPFIDTESDCYDGELGKLFKDESGTYGVVGYGSQPFKNQITLYVNLDLLKAENIDFVGYDAVKDKSWDAESFAELLLRYTEKTGKAALTSVLSEEWTENLFYAMDKEGTWLDLDKVAVFGQEGRDEFMLCKVPFMIGVLSDVERMYQALDNYRMMPIPYMENGEYETFYDMESVYVFCVPKGNDRTDYTGIFLTAYHTASEYLPYSYFQQFLLEKYVRDEGTLRVIALVGKTSKYLPEKEIETEE